MARQGQTQYSQPLLLLVADAVARKLLVVLVALAVAAVTGLLARMLAALVTRQAQLHRRAQTVVLVLA